MALHRLSRRWLKIFWLHTGLLRGFDCFLQSRSELGFCRLGFLFSAA